MNLSRKLNVLVAIALVLAAIACSTPPSMSPPATSPSSEVATAAKVPLIQPSQPRPTTKPADALTSPPLEILSHTSYSDGDWYHIIGEVRNNSSTPMGFVRIVATLYDEGTVVGTDFTYTLLDVISPGDKSPFQTGTDKWQGTSRYKLQAQGRPTVISRAILDQSVAAIGYHSFAAIGYQ